MDSSNSTSQSIPVSGEDHTDRTIPSQFSEGISSLSASNVGVGMAKKLAGLRLAHEATMVEDNRELLKRNREVTYPIPDAKITEGYQPTEKPDDMHVGDIVMNTYPAPQPVEKRQPDPVYQQPAPAPQPAAESTLSKVAKAVAGPLVGAGVAVAAMSMMNKDDGPQSDYVNMPTLELIVPGEQDSLLEPQE